MAMRGWRAVVGTLGVWAMLAASGCGGDSDRPAATPTAAMLTATPASTLTGSRSATATAPPTHTVTGLVSPGSTAPVTATATAMAPATQTATAVDSATPTNNPPSPTPTASATDAGPPTVTATPLCPDNTATPTPVLACSPTGTPSRTGTRPQPTRTPTPGLAMLRWFDANPRYTSGVFLPLAEYTAASVSPLTTDAWTSAARIPSGAAADGATLLLISVQLNSGSSDAPVLLRIDDGDLSDAPSGALHAVDDQRLVDRSPEGGAIDSLPDGPTDLLVDTVLIDGQRWAFALYRAPRNYDSPDLDSSRVRSVTLSALQSDLLLNDGRFLVFRPLVIFVHGTAGDTSNWDHFDLWRDSINELSGFQDARLPFFADRVSYQWIALSSGHLTDNAATILPQIGRALESWKTRFDIAATQADIVTHSYGGPVARQVAQTQPDPNPLTTADQSNARSVTNWGHGMMHKLVTLAATHRGSALANSVAYLNQLRNGALRTDVCIDGIDIGGGALADQLVLSPALRGLHETRLPGHAVIGSGTVRDADVPSISNCTSGGCEICYSASGYHGEYSLYRSQDVPTGPYQSAGDLGGTICGFSFYCENFNHASYDRLTNYVFNLAYAAPFPYSDCDLATEFPNSDLTVSACSSRGQQTTSAYSTVEDFDPALRGRLSHTQLVSTPAVADRVRFLLQQQTTSEYFAPFPATGEPTSLEEQLGNVGSAEGLAAGTACASGPDNSLINSCYSECNSCEATGDTPPCFAEYRVVPAPLVLREIGQAAPVLVYGRVARGPLDGQWTNVQSLANQIWCTVGMSSSNPSVARITTWKDISGAPDQSGINVVAAVADGHSDISLTVQNNGDGPLAVDVTVDTTPPAAPQ